MKTSFITCIALALANTVAAAPSKEPTIRQVAALALFVPPVQPQTRREHAASWNTQSAVVMTPAPSSMTLQYERVNISGYSDADRAYPLIAAYLQRPELAHSVQEFVFDLDYLVYLWSLHCPHASRVPLTVSDGQHAAIRNHVDSLDLPLETLQQMKDSLDWWRETVKARPTLDPNKYSLRGSGLNDANEKMMYIHYASTAAALIISLSPNITTLYLGRVQSGPLRQYLLRSNYGLTSTPALQKLQHVEYYGGDILHRDGDTYDRVELLDQFRYFHRLLQISSVSMEAVMEYDVVRRIFPPKTSRIKKIHLGHSDMSGEMLSTIIRLPIGLEEMSFSLGGLWHTKGGTPIILVGLVGRSLEQHKSTLRVLDMDLGEAIYVWMDHCSSGRDEDVRYTGYEEEKGRYRNYVRDEFFSIDNASSEGPLRPQDIEKPEHQDGRVIDLRHYTALTHLSINIEAIVGPTYEDYVDKHTTPRHKLIRQLPYRLVDALPTSLEYLCLYGYQKGKVVEIDEQVEELMEKKDERFPILQEIRGIDRAEHAVVIEEDPNSEGRGYWKRPDISLEWVEA
ncbi:uncharacterized protein DNG_02301 [Cephalotrichum gorgonifer]|uniref:Uncharacterized protein n=1 Tax=Cephalotrichum gorgonifer TaxID=2041049 RepID=A0AAE8MUK8_9PEZI|nr:uncharacterized protein DNG_02301 [Cephalotrichum gorgonifer]